MTELLTQSLARIVTANHQTAAVFEKYKLDFCCKGKRTLQEACRENKINPADVLLDLEKTAAADRTADPATLSLHDLTVYIVRTHHEYVRRELPLIYGYLEKVSSKHGDRHPELHKIFACFAAVKEEMELHMQKEEKILFPRIVQVEEGKREGLSSRIASSFIGAPVAVMEQEHDHAGSLMAEIRSLTADYTPPADACTTYKLSFAALQAFEQDLHRHVHLENNILFPGAMALIGETGAFGVN